MIELAYFTFGALLGALLYANRDLIPRPTPRRKRGAVRLPDTLSDKGIKDMVENLVAAQPVGFYDKDSTGDLDAFLYGKHKIEWWHLREAEQDASKRCLSLREYARVNTYSDS